MYVTKHFKEDAKTAMIEMVQYIKEEFRHILDEVHDLIAHDEREYPNKTSLIFDFWTISPYPSQIDWMDGETRKRAHKKLNAIKDYIAYPKEILDNNKLEEEYQGLEISGEEYFQNSINMSIWSTNKHWRKLREVVSLP